VADQFKSRTGRPATSPRLIAGLLYLQHAFDLSDEEVVATWVENPYWQVFTGEIYLQTRPPIDPSSLTRWRKRLGEAGVEEMLSLTLVLAQELGMLRESSLKTVIVDTTVMPKAIAHPTDSRLLERTRQHLVKAARACGLKLRQSYSRVAPQLARQVGRHAHAGQFKRLRNVLVVFDEFEGNELLSPRAAQDYQGVYLGLYRELRLKRTGKEDIQDDLTFEIELVRQTEINLDYILSLVAEARLNGSSSLEMLLDEVREVVGASVSLWSKKELIERFIAHYSSQATKEPIKECWQQFVPGQMQQDLMRIIDREHLKPRETWRFMDGALRDGTLQTVGPDWSRILPEELTYLSEGYRETKRRVIDQLSLFFECYAGLIGQGDIASLQSYPI